MTFPGSSTSQGNTSEGSELAPKIPLRSPGASDNLNPNNNNERPINAPVSAFVAGGSDNNENGLDIVVDSNVCTRDSGQRRINCQGIRQNRARLGLGSTSAKNNEQAPTSA